MKYKKALIKIVHDETGNYLDEGDVCGLKTVHIVKGVAWIHVVLVKDKENFPELLTAEVLENFCRELTPVELEVVKKAVDEAEKIRLAELKRKEKEDKK